METHNESKENDVIKFFIKLNDQSNFTYPEQDIKMIRKNLRDILLVNSNQEPISNITNTSIVSIQRQKTQKKYEFFREMIEYIKLPLVQIEFSKKEKVPFVLFSSNIEKIIFMSFDKEKVKYISLN